MTSTNIFIFLIVFSTNIFSNQSYAFCLLYGYEG